MLIYIIGEIMNLIDKVKFGKFLKSLSISKIDTLSGVEFEVFIADFFSYLGYKTRLTASSGDNGIDIIATKKRYSIGIQTKLYYNHNVSNKAIQEVFSGKNYYKTTFALAISNWNFSTPAKNLASQLGVGIVDRGILTTMLSNSRKANVILIKSLLN